MIVLDIPKMDGSDATHQWRQKFNQRSRILLTKHLPSLDHDGEADQTSLSGISDRKVVKINRK